MKKWILAVAMTMVATFAVASSLTDGLVAYWPFDGNTKDASGHGYKLGKKRGAVSWTVDRLGNNGFAACFNGTTDLLGEGEYAANSLTVSVWCKPSGNVPTSQGESLSYFQGGNMPNCQYVLFPNHGGDSSSGKAGVGLLVGQNGIIVIEHAANYCPLPLVWLDEIGANWTLVTITISGNDAPRLYVNGVFVRQGLKSSKKKFVGSYIGGGGIVGNDACFYSGLMDDFRIYNRALSASEIKSLYEEEVVQLHKVTFDANSGEGSMEEEVVIAGANLLLPTNKFYKDGFVFQGWALSSTGEVVYEDKAEIPVDSDITLYAVWANPALTLTAESANWSSGSITLKCEDSDTSRAAHTYSLEYKNENGAWTNINEVAATSIARSADGLAHLTDNTFWSRLGGIPPVEYRVKDENGRVSVGCVTRNRYLLAVGYSEYENNWKNPARQTLGDATELIRLCVERGRFMPDNARLLSNSDATTNGIRNVIADFSNRVRQGDLFVFYIATHGGDYRINKLGSIDIVKGSCLGAYGKETSYPVDALQSDVRIFPTGVAVIGIIVACHSQSMAGGVDERPEYEKINEWLANCGFGQCLGNVAWITSCASSQNSYYYDNEDYTIFGQSFIYDGFKNGHADDTLYGVEFEGGSYKGGNSDGVITLGELGRYAVAFAKGKSDDKPSSVQLDENTGLLDHIVLGRRMTVPTWIRPATPTNVKASDGEFNEYVKVDWDDVASATCYKVYRYPLSSPDEWKWLGLTKGTSSFCKDETTILTKEYGYRIRAVNPIGVSDLSYVAVGSRGTPDFVEYLISVSGATTASADEYDAMEKTTAANGCLTVGQCYMLGINPEDPNDDLKISHFEIKDGKPVITLNHTEDGSGNSFTPRVKTLGKANLSDAEWHEVPENGDPTMRFFKVSVELP